jgi:hypothetical protein
MTTDGFGLLNGNGTQGSWGREGGILRTPIGITESVKGGVDGEGVGGGIGGGGQGKVNVGLQGSIWLGSKL